MAEFIDLTGRQFGTVRVLRRGEKSGNDYLWLCVCSCGCTKWILGHNLKRWYKTPKSHKFCVRPSSRAKFA